MAMHHGTIIAAILACVGAVATAAALAPGEPAPGVASAASEARPSAVTGPAPVPGPGAAAPERRSAAWHARQALAAHRATFVERCWTPPTGTSPDHVDLRFNLAFDPRGALVGIGVSDSRKAFRPEVSACIRGLSVALEIPPPGAPVQVQVPLTLP